MSTLRVSNIEAKADPSSPSVDEKLKVTNSNGDVLVHIDGKTAGITTVGINTTDSSFTVDAAQNIEFVGIVTATKFSLSGGGEITGGDGNFTGIVTATSISATDSTIGVATITSLTASAANFTGNVSIAGTLTYEDVTNVDSIGIATARTGIDVTGGHIDLVDNSKIRVGTGDDLEIYHDGTHSYIKNETGNLYLQHGGENMAQFTSDGNVELYHDNSKKLETTSTGAKVTGALEVTQEYPSIRPILDLNFAATKTLDRRIQFTRDSIGTYYGENGLVKYATNNVPRFDHDPDTGESLGLLIEESRTNLFPYGITPGSNWSGAIANSTFTENTTEVTAPDGTNTATKWEFTSGDPYLYHQHTLLANTTYTMSIWVKAGTNMAGDVLEMRIGNAPYSTFANSTIPADGSWKRLTFTKTVGGSNETNVNVGFEPQTNPSGVPASGDVVYIWGAQLEIGSFVTSFIPTSGSTVTRAQDTAKITGTNFTDFYNQTEGTAFVNALMPNPKGNSGIPAYAFKTSANSNYYYGFSRDSVGAYHYINTSNANTFVRESLVNEYRAVLGIKTNDLNSYINDANQNVNLSTVTLFDADILHLGSTTTTNVLNGHIKQFKYYNKRLPDAQLQGLTQQ